MIRIVNIKQNGNVVWIWNGLNNIEVEGIDFATSQEWRDAILEIVRDQISQFSIEDSKEF